MELTASQLMVQPSSTRIPPHGRRFQPVKKGDETPKSFVEFNKEFGGDTASYHAYLQAFHEKSEVATIKCKLVTTDGITVEADKLKGLEELDVDDQQVAQDLVHSRVLRLRRADRQRDYMNAFDSGSETDDNPTAGTKTADQSLLSFSDYYLDIATGDEYLPNLRFAIPNLYPADNMRYLTAPLFENDDMLYHSNRFKLWWEEESALSIQPNAERLEMHPESLKDRIGWYRHLVSTRAPLPTLSQHSRSKVHWNEMIYLSREHEHHVDRLRAIRHEINNANKRFPSDFKLSSSGEMIQSREQLWTALMNCSARPRVKYVPPWRCGRHYVRPGSVNIGDVPLHPVPEFLYQDLWSVERRTRFINLIREHIAYSIMDRPSKRQLADKRRF
jgi:hypothetical protein